MKVSINVNQIGNRSSLSRRFLGEHEQVRAAPALQLNFLQHVFTMLKQDGRAATSTEIR
jgi:hypothetical protein